jgi:putative transposase
MGPHTKVWGMIGEGNMRQNKYYHIWFPTKNRKRVLMGEIDERMHELFEKIAADKGFGLIAYETMINHAHFLVSISNGYSLPRIVKMLKGVSARRIFQEFPRLKEQMREKHFWAKNYAANPVPKEILTVVMHYIKGQKEKFGGI